MQQECSDFASNLFKLDLCPCKFIIIISNISTNTYFRQTYILYIRVDEKAFLIIQSKLQTNFIFLLAGHCQMIEDTDIFEVLTFDQELQVQQVTNTQLNLLGQQKQKDEIQNKQASQNTRPFLFAPNEFEEQYHQPIRKKSLRAFVDEDERESREQRQKEQLKERPTFEDSKEIEQLQEATLAHSMFNISYFCQNSTQFKHSNKKQLQNVQIKSNIVKKTTSHKVQNKENKVVVINKDGRYYWQLNNEIEIDLEIIKNVYDKMLDRECFVPVFAFDKYAQWAKAKSKNKEYLTQAEKVFKIYLLSYTAFLNQHYFEEFCQILLTIFEGRQLSLPLLFSKKSSKDSKKYSQELCQRKFDLGSLIQGLYQFLVTSKTEILRKAMIQKIRSLAVTRKQCQHLKLIEYSQILYEKQQENWKVLAQIDFLLSLESTENYCVKKIQISKERKGLQFWQKYLLYTKKLIKQAKQSQLLHLYI